MPREARGGDDGDRRLCTAGPQGLDAVQPWVEAAFGQGEESGSGAGPAGGGHGQARLRRQRTVPTHDAPHVDGLAQLAASQARLQ